MPYRTLDLPQAAAYLHLTCGEVEQLMRTADLPHVQRGGRVVFVRGDLDAWASQRILGLPPKRLADYHRQSTRGTRSVFGGDALIPELMQAEYIEAALQSRTKQSVIRDLVAFAEGTGRVLDAAELLGSIEEREALGTTGLPGGLALLHCRNHQPYRFEGSFIVLGRTVQAIHFGAPDGRPTWLFFLICCQDERIHLHTLARLCLLAQKTDLIGRLYEAPDAAAMYACLVAAELAVLTGAKPAAAPAG